MKRLRWLSYRIFECINKGYSMSYPSFHTYLKTLQELLKRKKPELAQESTVLANLCQAYGQRIGLTEREITTLLLAAYYKNLGALTISHRVFCQSFDHYGQLMARVVSWFEESSELAETAGLPEVATVLSQYYQRTIPAHPLAKIFQVLNAWVSCHQNRGWRLAMSDRDALIVLKQRAILAWSDPKVVAQFIRLMPTASRSSQPPLLPPFSPKPQVGEPAAVAHAGR
jgi:response regulator RpfG family c-di-GMP phosphodiesterase